MNKQRMNKLNHRQQGKKYNGSNNNNPERVEVQTI